MTNYRNPGAGMSQDEWQMLQEAGAAPQSGVQQQTGGAIGSAQRHMQGPQAAAPPTSAPPAVNTMQQTAAQNTSSQGLLTDWNFERHKQGLPPMSMHDFARVMQASGHQGAPNMEGYAAMRQMLGMGIPMSHGDTPQAGFPTPEEAQATLDARGPNTSGNPYFVPAYARRAAGAVGDAARDTAQTARMMAPAMRAAWEAR